MTRIADNHEKAFYVTAFNIQTDESDLFGPFPGDPQLTYEFVRDGEGNHIFIFADPQIEDGEAHASDAHWTEPIDHWHDQEGDYRRDGWRRCFDVMRDEIRGEFGVAHGFFSTDLVFDSVPAGDLEFDPATYNRHPDPLPSPTDRVHPRPVGLINQ